MNVTDIKAGIAKAGTSQKAIADYLGICSTAVGHVIRGTARSARVEAEIAKIMGEPMYPTFAKRGPKKTKWNGEVAA